MAKLEWDFQHYVYTRGIDTLKRAYLAATSALQSEIARIETEALEYETALANGGEWIGERDDEGYPLWDQSQIYSFEVQDAELAICEVRKAFVIAFYHHWEHSAAIWRGSAGSHSELVCYCEKQGYGPSPHIDALRYLANFFKHGKNSKTDWLNKLRAKYPEFMPRNVDFVFGLSDSDLDDIADIVLASGPPALNGT